MRSEVDRTPQNQRVKLSLAIAAAGAICALAFQFTWAGRKNSVDVQAAQSMELKSASFSEGSSIPARYTCDGAGESPSLDWLGAPAATKSFALILHDPDAPVDFTHWVAYDIPAGVHELAEGAASGGGMPSGSVEGMNGFRRIGYGGPCPPGNKPHHYIFQLYALDTNLRLPAGATRKQVESAMQSHIVATGRLVGIYRRSE